VKLWSATDFTLKGILKGHKRGVWDCQFSSYDRVVATCSGDKTIKLWSLGDFSCVRTFQGHSAGTLRVRFLFGGLQLITCDGEGIIRLWSIRSNECVFSMDAHEDKIWALDLSSDGKMLVTGAADSRLKVFHDTTKELEEQNRKIDEQNILMEQKLANHLRFKEFEQALDIALDMDKPRQTLKVLIAIVENDLANDNNALTTLQKHLKNWDSKRIVQILTYCREWNTRARNSHISMLTVKAIFTSKAADELACINGLPEILEGILPYAERHFERIDKLYTNSFLVDFTLVSMGDLETVSVDEYVNWEKTSKLVLPPKKVDGRVQIGGQAVIGFRKADDDISTTSSDNEVLTVGESDTEESADDSSVDTMS
jgi:U3 small nucleolar RNA-associated protein 13